MKNELGGRKKSKGENSLLLGRQILGCSTCQENFIFLALFGFKEKLLKKKCEQKNEIKKNKKVI